MPKARKTFDVWVKVTVETVIPIKAETFEEALAEARTYGVRDVVSFDTDFNDGGIEVTGVMV